MPRTNQNTLAVSEVQELNIEPKSLVRKRKPDSNLSKSETNNSQAVVLQQLEELYDDDLRLAMLQRIADEFGKINQIASREEKISHALEAAQLAAVQAAQNKGKQQARREAAEKKREQKLANQKNFIEVELPALLDNCAHMDYESMKQVVNQCAAMFGLQLEWEELTDGQYKCTPILPRG